MWSTEDKAATEPVKPLRYQVIRATTRRRSIPSKDGKDYTVVRRGSWDECEAMMVHLHDTEIGNLESHWVGTDMLVRVGSTGTMFIVYRIMPEEA